MLSNPASRRVCTARRTSSGRARRSSTASSSRLEALRAERDAIHAVLAQQRARARRSRSPGFASTVTSLAAGQRGEQPLERARLGERRRAAADEHGVERLGQPATLELELASSASTYARVLVRPPDNGDEVAVAAAVSAERQVDVEVPGSAPARGSRSRLTASCRRRG